eukprot:scaffold22309_cov116-Isochrysis_galbana.AAC.6
MRGGGEPADGGCRGIGQLQGLSPAMPVRLCVWPRSSTRVVQCGKDMHSDQRCARRRRPSSQESLWDGSGIRAGWMDSSLEGGNAVRTLRAISARGCCSVQATDGKRAHACASAVYGRCVDVGIERGSGRALRRRDIAESKLGRNVDTMAWSMARSLSDAAPDQVAAA